MDAKLRAARPKQVSIGVGLAAACYGLGMLAVVVYGPAIGEGWVFILFLQFLISAVWAILLIQIFHGKGWARIVVLVAWTIGFGRVGSTDVRLLLEPFTLAMFCCSFAAIVLWFSRESSGWFRRTAADRRMRRR